MARRRQFVLVGLVGLLAAVAVALVMVGPTGWWSSGHAGGRLTAEQLLVMEDSRATALQYGDLLDQLEPHCHESRVGIATAAVAAHAHLTRQGFSDSVLVVLKAMVSALPLGTARSCTNLAAALATLVAGP